MADNDQLLYKIGNLIDQKLEPIKKDMATKQDIQRVEYDLRDVKQTQSEHGTILAEHSTILEAVAAGQKELQETVATKADVLTVGVKVDKLRKRIEGIEEHTGRSTHKN